MWKSLKPGDEVYAGDTIRYLPDAPTLSSSRDQIYEVVRIDQHHFEIIARTDKIQDEPHRKVVRYMDIGYNISLEKWAGKTPYERVQTNFPQ
jgi:hypothetical protein